MSVYIKLWRFVFNKLSSRLYLNAIKSNTRSSTTTLVHLLFAYMYGPWSLTTGGKYRAVVNNYYRCDDAAVDRFRLAEITSRCRLGQCFSNSSLVMAPHIHSLFVGRRSFPGPSPERIHSYRVQLVMSNDHDNGGKKKKNLGMRLQLWTN